MSFRRRLALVSAAAVAFVVVVGSVVTYALVRASLRGQIDASLRMQAGVVAAGAQLPFKVTMPPEKALRDPPVVVQLVRPGGDVVRAPQGSVQLPAGDPAEEVAAGHREPFFSDREIDGVHVRVYTAVAGDGQAVQVFRSLTEVDQVLGSLRVGLGLIALIGIAGAALLGRVAARTAVQPVAELTSAAEHVAATRDLSRRIAAGGRDELARLAAAFNTMLEALEESRRAQRQLVADASHELRTPLTSLRTNLEVLAGDRTRPDVLDESDRERLRADVVAQLGELTELVGDLVDLARDEEPPEAERVDVRLDRLVAEAVDRARRHAPEVTFTTQLEPCLVSGAASRLDRAVANLLDNAAKFGGEGGPVEVSVQQGEVAVRDHGPGIAAEDLPHIFDRFRRAASARGRPGSGLGLAIVRQVAEAHGGSVAAEPAAGGGALLRLRLPLSSNS